MKILSKYIASIFIIFFSLTIYIFLEWKFYTLEKKIANNFEGVEIPIPASIERGLNKSLNTLNIQTTKTNEELKNITNVLNTQTTKTNEELKSITNMLNAPKKRYEKYLILAGDEKIDFQTRNVLYLAALSYSENKDAILKKYISFVSNQINALIKNGEVDEAANLYELLISTKNNTIASGTPENILNMAKYDELTIGISKKLNEALDSKTDSEETTYENETMKSLESQMKFFEKISNSDVPLKLMMISKIKQELDSFIINVASEEKDISSIQNLKKLINKINTLHEKFLKDTQKRETEEYNEKRKNYQRFVLSNIYAFRNVLKNNEISATRMGIAIFNSEQKTENEKMRKNIYEGMKKYILPIDSSQLDYFVAKMFNEEREKGSKMLEDSSELMEEIAKDEIKIKKITFDEIPEQK